MHEQDAGKVCCAVSLALLLLLLLRTHAQRWMLLMMMMMMRVVRASWAGLLQAAQLCGMWTFGGVGAGRARALSAAGKRRETV